MKINKRTHTFAQLMQELNKRKLSDGAFKNKIALFNAGLDVIFLP